MLLSDAREGRREGSEGICRIAFAPDGGCDTLARPTASKPASGSLDRAFLSAADDPLAVVSCCHDRALSALTVRDSVCSMATALVCVRLLFVQKLLLWQASAL
jgi:hypothetical protein